MTYHINFDKFETTIGLAESSVEEAKMDSTLTFERAIRGHLEARLPCHEN